MIDDVIKMYLDGYTMLEIANKYGTYIQKISKILHSNGVNTSQHELLKGQHFKNKQGDSYVVVEDYILHGHGMCKIRFDDTGYETVLSSSKVKSGEVRDYYKKTIYGVACKGHISCPKKSFARLCFHRWQSMVSRCYNPKSNGYKSYGAKGVRISVDWLIFENFFNDLPKIQGFDKEKYINHEIELGKDTKNQLKLYSLENCVFIPVSTNRKFNKVRPFKAISPDGKETIYNTQAECARNLNMISRSIGKCLNKQLKHHHNYKFEYLEPQTTIPNGSSE